MRPNTLRYSDLRGLLDQVQPHLNFDQGDITMFVMDMPNVPPQYAPVVIAQASQVKKGDAQTDRTIGVCHLIENQPESLRSAINSMSPVLGVMGYLQRQEPLMAGQLTIEDVYKTAKISVLQGPAHGTLEELGGVDRGGYLYLPAPDYLGPDRATLLVEIGGLKVKVLYFFNVLPGVPDSTESFDPYKDKKYCPQGKGEVWRISLNPDDPNAPIYTFEHPSQITSALAGVVQANLTFADLPGEALGQTFGNTITLDTNAAGHGWFLDTTPWDNSEFVGWGERSEPQQTCRLI